jgi:hypothetical protein
LYWLARQIDACLTRVRHHDTDIADVDDRLRNHLNGREQPIDVVGALDERLQLAAAEAARLQELFRVLKIVVIQRRHRGIVAPRRRDDLPVRERGAVMHRDDADDVDGVLDHDRLESVPLRDDHRHPLERVRLRGVKRQEMDALVRDHDELRGVEGIGTLTQDLALRSALTAGAQEGGYVLKVIGRDVARQRLRRRQWLPVACEDVADLTLRDRDQRHLVQAILERHQHVPATSQQGGLKAGLAVQGDEAARHGSRRAPQFFDDADAIVRDVPEREQQDCCNEQREYDPEYERQGHHGRECRHDGPPITPTGLADGLEVGSPLRPDDRCAPNNLGPPRRRVRRLRRSMDHTRRPNLLFVPAGSI